MRKNNSGPFIVLRLIFTRNQVLAALTGAFLCAGPLPLGGDTTTLSTLYPAPYGSYNNLSAGKLTVKEDASLSGTVNLNSVQISGLSAPTAAQDPATKAWVDQQFAAYKPTPTCMPSTCSAAEPKCGQTTTGTDNCGGTCSKTGPACTYTTTTCQAQCMYCPAWSSGYTGCWSWINTTLGEPGYTTYSPTSTYYCNDGRATICTYAGDASCPGKILPPQYCTATNTPSN